MVLAKHGTSLRGHVYYLCKCKCNRERPVRVDALIGGVSKSCGCSQFERFSHLYKDDQQHCPVCQNWLPLSSFSKYYRGKIGEPCRECRRLRVSKSYQKLTREEKRAKTLQNTYKISLPEYYKIAARQHNRCCGCQETFDPLDLVVDHDHKTNKIRGLLCNNCNVLLGRAKDSVAILYRLNAYLSRDASKLMIYVIGSLRNPNVTKAANMLRQNDKLDVFDDYMAAGPEADDFWKSYEIERKHNYIEAINGRAASHVFFYDKGFLDMADAVVVVLPVGKSCMLEAGYCKAKGKSVYFLLDAEHNKERYDVMQKFADGFCQTVNDLFPLLEEQYEHYIK